MHAQQMIFVGRRTAVIRVYVDFRDRGLAGASKRRIVNIDPAQQVFRSTKTGRLIERRAQNNPQIIYTSSVALRGDGDPQRRPVMNRARRDLDVD